MFTSEMNTPERNVSLLLKFTRQENVFQK